MRKFEKELWLCVNKYWSGRVSEFNKPTFNFRRMVGVRNMTHKYIRCSENILLKQGVIYAPQTGVTNLLGSASTNVSYRLYITNHTRFLAIINNIEMNSRRFINPYLKGEILFEIPSFSSFHHPPTVKEKRSFAVDSSYCHFSIFWSLRNVRSTIDPESLQLGEMTQIFDKFSISHDKKTTFFLSNYTYFVASIVHNCLFN